MSNLQGNGGKRVGPSRRLRSATQPNRIALPRGIADPRRPEVRPAALAAWKQLPLTTRLYFLIIAALAALLLLLISIRYASLSMSFGLLRSLRGETSSAQDALTATAQGLGVPAGKPVAFALVNTEMRSGPAASYPAIGLLEQGQAAEVVGVSLDGFWWAVHVPYIEGERAWIPNTQVQVQNTEGVEVLSLPAEMIPRTQSPANPAIATALMNVNIRSGPGLNYPKIGLLEEDQEAEVVGVDAERFWYLVKVPGEENLQGWLSRDYVKIKNGDGLPVVGPQVGTPMLIPLTIVNVRAGPGKEYEIIGSLEKGQGAEIIGVSPDGEWWAIRFGSGPDGQGWVSAKFVKAENTSGVPVIKQ